MTGIAKNERSVVCLTINKIIRTISIFVFLITISNNYRAGFETRNVEIVTGNIAVTDNHRHKANVYMYYNESVTHTKKLISLTDR